LNGLQFTVWGPGKLTSYVQRFRILGAEYVELDSKQLPEEPVIIVLNTSEGMELLQRKFIEMTK
jgi:hypothetical protein